jgi:hypothetical protein
MDVLEVLASGMTGSMGGHGQGFLQFLELQRCHESIGCLAALLVVVIGLLDVSTDGDVIVWS